MDAWTGMVFIWGLSMISLIFFVVLYYANEFSARRAKQQEMLLQRIQAPQVAVDQHVIQQAQEQERKAARWDDDDDFHSLMGADAIGFNPMSDE